MTAPIFSVCNASNEVKSKLGSSPLRLYEFGLAPQDVAKPYAVWQVVSGSPENFLGARPSEDAYRLQVDVYGVTASSVREAGKAIQYAIELVAHVVSYNGETTDPVTKNRRYSFDVSWIVARPS